MYIYTQAHLNNGEFMKNYERINISEPTLNVDLGDFLEGHNLFIDIKPTQVTPGGYCAKFVGCDIMSDLNDGYITGPHAVGNTPAQAVTKLCDLIRGKWIIRFPGTSKRAEIKVPWTIKNNFIPAMEVSP